MDSSWKRYLKCGISLGVFAALEIRRILVRLIGLTPSGSCVVLYYHSIPDGHRAQFAQQLDRLLSFAKPARVSGPIQLEPGRHHVGVTFDDAFENFVTNALPELEKRRIPAIVFVISDALGNEFGRRGFAERVMSSEQLRALPPELVCIGSHTMTHPLLPSVAESEAALEITESKARIEALLQRPVELFSFPYGGFTARLVDLCRQAGYAHVFTTLPHFAFRTPGEFAVGRVRVDPTDSPLEFRLKIAGSYCWLPLVFSLKRRILSNPLTRRLLGDVKPAHSAPLSAIVRESREH
jgi:peptidoglycan/xylan/chitin deacetylase (PgdA/CDA1 family)